MQKSVKAPNIFRDPTHDVDAFSMTFLASSHDNAVNLEQKTYILTSKSK